MGLAMSSAKQNDQANPPQVFGVGHNSGAAEREPLLLDYLLPEELAAELGVDTRTLARWHNLGIGPPQTKIGRKPLYWRPSTKEWLRNREQKPPRELPRSRRAARR
jgi:hypothetical protein